MLGELKDAASRDVSHFSCCAARSSSSSCSCRKGSSKRQVVVGASENPAIQSGAGEFPVVTTKPTIIRMLVCHRVSLLGYELCFLPPCESRIIYFGSLRFSFPLSGKKAPPLSSLPLLPVPSFPTYLSVGRLYCSEILCLRTIHLHESLARLQCC